MQSGNYISTCYYLDQKEVKRGGQEEMGYFDEALRLTDFPHNFLRGQLNSKSFRPANVIGT